MPARVGVVVESHEKLPPQLPILKAFTPHGEFNAYGISPPIRLNRHQKITSPWNWTNFVILLEDQMAPWQKNQTSQHM